MITIPSALCFLDTETTSLRYDRRAWEVAVILRRPGKPDHEQSWFVEYDDLQLGDADPASLRIGRFYERHPQAEGRRSDRTLRQIGRVMAEDEMLFNLERLTRGAHIVGAVPNFDTEMLAARMRAHGLCPAWNYHLIDVEALMLGALAACAQPVPVPWRSDDLAAALGIEPAADGERHTAVVGLGHPLVPAAVAATT